MVLEIQEVHKLEHAGTANTGGGGGGGGYTRHRWFIKWLMEEKELLY
jgi:hypothetical protein